MSEIEIVDFGVEEEKRILKKGSLVMPTYGEYSDYQVHSICRVTCDFDIDEVAEEYKRVHPEQWSKYGFYQHDKFIDWVITEKQLLEELDYFEWQTAYQFKDDEGLFAYRIRGGDWK